MSVEQMSVVGKVALVTGASRGLGLASAKLLADRGAFVVGTATTLAGAARLSDALGDKGVGVVLDVTVDSDVARVVSGIQAERGAIHILVNNAGITKDNLLIRSPDADWNAVIATNLTAVQRVSKAVVRGMMKQRDGRIITIGSIVGATGNAGQTAYAAAKAGVVAFSKSLAMEVGGRQVTVNVIAPGCIATDMTDVLPDVVRQQAIDHTPLGRIGDPKDIAEAVAFLASPAAGFITGVTLHVNGGMHMF